MSQMDNQSQVESKQHDDDNGISGLDQNDNDHIKYKLLHSGEPVILNIGGIKYSTSLVTLLSYSGSIFSKIFSGFWLLKPCNDGSYFFDRNGELFKYVLEFLRNNKLNIADDTTLINALIDEAEYYRLEALTSELLMKKTKSMILKKGDAEFITKCVDQTFTSFGKSEISYKNLIYTYTGNNNIDYDKLHGLDRLLIVVCSELDDRFAFYIHDKYTRESDGFVVELNSALTGERCVRKKYMPWEPGNGVQFYVIDSSESAEMFTAVIFYNEGDEFLECEIKRYIDTYDTSGFRCECKWKQTNNDRTVFDCAIKRFEIFRVL